MSNEKLNRQQMMRKGMGRPMKSRRRSKGGAWNAGYFLREGFVGIFRHGLMSFAAVCMIMACLLIMGTFSLVAVDLDVNRQRLEQQNEFTAYLDDDLSLSRAQALEERLLAVPNVRSARFVDREEVLAQFREDRQNENNELYDLLPNDVFQHRYRVHVTDIDKLEDTVKAVRAVPGVESVSADLDIAEGMIAVRNIAAGVAAVLVGLLVLVSLFIIANTLRLALFYRRDEIAIMKMCGATNGFIRWPFIVEGAMLGLFSALFAFFLQWMIYDAIVNAVAAGGRLGFLVVLSFKSLWSPVLLIFCGAGVVIGVLGSLLAIRKFLKV